MGGKEGDNLFRGYAECDCTANRLAGYFSGDHIGIAGVYAGEELEDSDLELRCCVCVDAVIGLDDNEALAICGAESIVKASGDAAKGTRIRCECCGKAGGVEAA